LWTTGAFAVKRNNLDLMKKKGRLAYTRFLWGAAAILSVWGVLWLHQVDFYFMDHPDPIIEEQNLTLPSNGLSLAARLYRPTNRQPGTKLPAVVLLHGTSPKGSHLFLYHILAEQLCRGGAIVLVYDQRGYAASPDPPLDSNGEPVLDFVGDAIRAVRFIASQPEVDPSKVVLVGHSFGGSVAIGVAHEPGINRLLRRIVVISPGRGWPYQGDERFTFRRRRLTQDMELNRPIRLETIRALYRDFEVETLLERKNMIYVRLVNGAREEQVKPLTGIYAKMSPPKDIRIIPGTGHYFNTNYLFNRLDLPIKIFRADKIQELAKAIEG